MYDDLSRLFRECLDKDYSPDQYSEQFCICIPENLEKVSRIEKIFRSEMSDMPQILSHLLRVLEEQRCRLSETRSQHSDYVDPFELMDQDSAPGQRWSPLT